MSGIIQDGRGTGNKAEVDDHGRLATKAVYVSHNAHHSTYHKNLYIAKFETTLSDANTVDIAFLKNATGNKDMEIVDVYVKSNADIEFRLSVNDVYSSGGTSISPKNMNLGANFSESITCYEGGASNNLAVTSTDRVELDAAFNGSNRESCFCYEGGLIVTPNKTVSVQATGANTNKVIVTIIYSFHGAGVAL